MYITQSGFKCNPHKVVVFFSHIIPFHISCSLLSILGAKCQRLFSYLSAYSGVSYTHTCLIWVPRTVQLLMINITFWILILKWRNFLIILFWVSFKLKEWGFATFFTVRRHGTATTNLWVDQCAVCSALKSDTFTLVTVTFEWLGQFRKTKISMKAV